MPLPNGAYRFYAAGFSAVQMQGIAKCGHSNDGNLYYLGGGLSYLSNCGAHLGNIHRLRSVRVVKYGYNIANPDNIVIGGKKDFRQYSAVIPHMSNVAIEHGLCRLSLDFSGIYENCLAVC